jgi:hypothetical protein
MMLWIAGPLEIIAVVVVEEARQAAGAEQICRCIGSVQCRDEKTKEWEPEKWGEGLHGCVCEHFVLENQSGDLGFRHFRTEERSAVRHEHGKWLPASSALSPQFSQF